MDITALAELDRRFLYERDGFDSWRILDARTGRLRGDCDDYAVTALWLLCGRSMTRFWRALACGKAAFWYAKARDDGAPHLMLHVKGLGWFDNTTLGKGPQKDTHAYVKNFRAPMALVAIKMGLGKV